MSKTMTVADLEKAMKHTPKAQKTALVKSAKESLKTNRRVKAEKAKAAKVRRQKPKFAFSVHAMEVKKDNTYGKMAETLGTDKLDEAIRRVRDLTERDSVREIVIHVRQ